MLLAAIDIGSNSVRSTIVDVPVGGPRRTVDEEKSYTRLGSGILISGELSARAMDETVTALRRMLSIAREYRVDYVRAVATAAVRNASNGPRFVTRIAEELGLDVEIITGEHEGRLALLSATANFEMQGDTAVVDIGGASVEIVRAYGREPTSVTSVPLGVVVTSERFHATDPMPAKDALALTTHVCATLDGTRALDPPSVGLLVGSGGTVTALAALAAAHRGDAHEDVHGTRISLEELARLRDRLVRSDAAKRAAMKAMPVSRVDLIVSGAIVLEEIARALGVLEILVNARGMREGLIVETVEHMLGTAVPFDRMRSVRELAQHFSAGMPHAEQVCRLSLELFDRLTEPLGLDPAERPLLEAAAILHDVGYHISYEQHHKHAYRLIAASELPGFSAHDRRIIAGIARYHKGSLPKGKHEAMQGLDPDARETVSRMAALLRIADGLDRSDGQLVTALDIEPRPHAITVRVLGATSLEAELYGARHKADLLEKVWGVDVRIIADTAAPDVRGPQRAL